MFWNKVREYMGIKPGLYEKLSSHVISRKQNEQTSVTETEKKPNGLSAKSGNRKPLALVSATLYFSGWGYTEREKYGDVWHGGERVALLCVSDFTFVLRRMSRYVMFRSIDDHDERAALFLLWENYDNPNIHAAYYPKNKFAARLRAKSYGRCMLFVSDIMTPYQYAYMLFHPDGTGVFLEESERELATFRWDDATSLTWRELLTAEPESLRLLCTMLFETRINPSLDNPYIYPASLVNVPHTFECGSEEELRRLTTIIIQSDPDMFVDNDEPVTVVYRAKTPKKRGYMQSYTSYAEDGVVNGRLQSLCDLTLRLNTFTGIHYQAGRDHDNRFHSLRKKVHQIEVEVQPPSAHERTESLLMLAEWLEGKVRPAKRLRLLGVEGDAQTNE